MRMAVFAPLVALVTAFAQVNYPLNLQFPPIAKVGQAYIFRFAPTTFQPDSDKLQYSLIGNPRWLHVDSNNRTLWGTPSTDDIGMANFTLAAAGEAGAVANLDSKLLVADGSGPKLNANISQQLSKSGPLSGPESVTLLPSKPFEISFSSDSFQSNGKDLTYHATLTDHTPLPSWISFDPQSLRFAGTTPSASKPQSFEILLIASDAPDYAAATLSFGLIVSDHQLLFKPLAESMDMPKGGQVNISGLKSKLFLDNVPVKDDDIQSTRADLPSWLSFNDQTLDITGDAPSGLMSQNISITVQDKYGDSAQHSIYLTFASQLFTTEVGQLNITVGEYFEHKIPKSILVHDNEKVEVDFGDIAKWMSFDQDSFTMHGTVPEDVSLRDVQGSMTATSSDGSLKDSQTFQIHISGPGKPQDSGNTATDSRSNQPSDNSDASNAHTESAKTRNAGVIVGSVVSGLFAAIILLSFICFLCRRRKQTQGYVSPKAPRSPQKTDISRPIPIAEDYSEVDRAHDADLEKGEDDFTLERTPEYAPRLDVKLITKHKKNISTASSIGEPGDKILTAFNRTSWGYIDEAGPSHRPHDSMKIPTEMLRRESASSALKQKRRTTQVYRDPHHRSSGLPVNRRLTGVGHGRHTHSPSRSSNNFSSLRRALSSSSYTTATNSMSMASTAPSAFPQSHAVRHTTHLTTPLEKRCSVRLVPKSPCDSLVDRRTIDEKRKSYIRKRASAQSPFFSAGTSRVSSSSYKLPSTLLSEPNSEAKTLEPRSPLTPLSVNIMTPNEDNAKQKMFERELPESLRIRKPSETPSPDSENTKYPGSLRKNRPRRTFTSRQMEVPAAANRVEKPYVRPGTTVYSRTSIGRRPSTRQSLATELKSSLNSLTGSKIYEDAELSESVYSTEDEDIEEYERRTTAKPGQFTLPPLNLNISKTKDDSKRDSKSSSKCDSKRGSKRNSKRELKRTSERDPTPYSLAIERGGKENQPTTYYLSGPPTIPPAKTAAKGKGKAKLSPERPKTSIGLHSSHHNRTQSRITTRSSGQRSSQGRPFSRIDSTKERHSRKSLHSRSQSRLSNTGPKKHRDRSRTQSSAYPFFDASFIINDTNKSTHAHSSSIATTLPRNTTNPSLLERDLSGNILDYALHESPKIEELSRNSIALRTSNGRVNSTARQSPLAQLHTSPFYHSRRDTATPVPETPIDTPSVGLGLTLLGGSLGHAEETPVPDSAGKGRERTPASMLDVGNGTGPERVRMREGKGKRPVSVEVGEQQGSGHGRRTWGSLRGVLGRSGGSFWGGKETKAFI